MTCERCGAELTVDEKGYARSANGRPTCPKGGPHKLPAVADDAEAWLRSL